MADYSNADFAQHLAYLAAHISRWSGDMLTLSEYANDQIDARSVKKFTDDIRMRLDYFDRRAALTEGKDE